VIEYRGQWKPPIDDSQIEIPIEFEPEWLLWVKIPPTGYSQLTSGVGRKAAEIGYDFCFQG
jgi:hypothetical protein